MKHLFTLLGLMSIIMCTFGPIQNLSAAVENVSIETIKYSQGYTPLAPLPIGENGVVGGQTEYSSLGKYLSGVFRLLIVIGGIGAILMLVVGGTQYVAASINPSAKSHALERIQHSLIGLGIILASYMLLNTINSKLVSFDLNLQKTTGGAKVSLTPSGDNLGTYFDVNGNVKKRNPDGTVTPTWPYTQEGNAVRAELERLSGGRVKIKEGQGECSYVGQQGCISMYGIQQEVLVKLSNLARGCGSTCLVTITGGTEYWRHGGEEPDFNKNTTMHKPNVSAATDGGLTVDLRLNNGLKEYLKKVGTKIDTTRCAPGETYSYDGGVYVIEEYRQKAGQPPKKPDHFHVCFYL